MGLFAIKEARDLRQLLDAMQASIPRDIDAIRAGNIPPLSPLEAKVTGRPRRMLLIVAMVAAFGSATLAACSTGTHPQQSSQTRSSATADRTPSPSSSASRDWTGGFSPEHTWTWSEESNGYRFSARLALGAPEHVEAVPLLTGFASASAIVQPCAQFNPETDALVPTAIQMRNLTHGFHLTVAALLANASDGFRELELSHSEGANVTCSPVQSGDAVVTWEDVGPGEWTAASRGYFVLAGYYSPAHPEGEGTGVWGLLIEPGGGFSLTSFTGPGATLGTSGTGDQFGCLAFDGSKCSL